MTPIDPQPILSFLSRLGESRWVMELGRVQQALERLGNPQERLRSVIVGGTNGKGSTGAWLESGLAPYGKVGFYNSPHLDRINERFRINGQEIEDERLADLTLGIGRRLDPNGDPLDAIAESRLTYFELGTCIAFQYFLEEGVEWTILEVGLGGRLDATNAASSELAIITGIGLDHTEWLGDTLEKIAGEKAGIIKENRPVLLGPSPPEVQEIIRKRAKEKGAMFLVAGRSFRWDNPVAPTQIEVGNRYFPMPEGFCPQTQFQRHNALMACAAMTVLLEPQEDLFRGLAQHHSLAGRFEQHKLPVHGGEANLVLDGAHNPDAARLLARELQMRSCGKPQGVSIEAHRAQNAQRDPVTVVAAFSQGHDASQTAIALAGAADRLIVTRLDHPRALDAAESEALLEKIRISTKLSASQIEWIDDLETALARALETSGPGAWIAVTGSLYLIQPCRRILNRRCGLSI